MPAMPAAADPSTAQDATAKTAPGTATPAARLIAYRDALYTQGHAEGCDGTQYPLWPVGVTREAGGFLCDLVTREHATRTLEVGLGLGLSAMFIVEALMARTSADSPAGPPSHVVVEPCPEFYRDAGLINLERSGAASLTALVKEDSAVALPRFVGEGRVFDLAYVDGSHHFDAAFVDVFFALRLVRPGGLIVVDDHWMPSIQAMLAFFHTNRAVRLELYDPAGSGRRFVGLRVPEVPDARAWDHFAEFSSDSLPAYPWKRPAQPDASRLTSA